MEKGTVRESGAFLFDLADVLRRPAGMNRSLMPRLVRAALALGILVLVTGCRSDSGDLPPVFGAVFGLDGAETIPFRTGKMPEPTVRPVDRVIGDAANMPGQCIYRTPQDRRFRANCPEGYAIGASR